MKELRDMKARVSERPYLFEQVKQVSYKLRRSHHVVNDVPLKHNFDFLLLTEKCEGSRRADIQEHAEDSWFKGAIC